MESIGPSSMENNEKPSTIILLMSKDCMYLGQLALVVLKDLDAHHSYFLIIQRSDTSSEHF